MSNDIFGDLANKIQALELVMKPIARDILRATVAEVPRPAFDTGALRRSGRAYVNGRLVSSTHRMREARGRNASTESRNRNEYPGDGSFTAEGSDIFEIVYKTDYAEKMHNWHGTFTDSESGPGYISAKMGLYESIIDKHLSRIFT